MQNEDLLIALSLHENNLLCQIYAPDVYQMFVYKHAEPIEYHV